MTNNDQGKTKKLELKWRHYVYEFFIVALGISVPFILNQWNENNILRKTEKVYLENIREELIADSTSIYGNMLYNQRWILNTEYMNKE